MPLSLVRTQDGSPSWSELERSNRTMRQAGSDRKSPGQGWHPWGLQRVFRRGGVHGWVDPTVWLTPMPPMPASPLPPPQAVGSLAARRANEGGAWSLAAGAGEPCERRGVLVTARSVLCVLRFPCSTPSFAVFVDADQHQPCKFTAIAAGLLVRFCLIQPGACARHRV